MINTTLIMLSLSLLSALFSIGMNFFSVSVGEGFARDLRDALFMKIQSFSYGNLDRMRTGQLIVRLTSDISMLQRIVQDAPTDRYPCPAADDRESDLDGLYQPFPGVIYSAFAGGHRWFDHFLRQPDGFHVYDRTGKAGSAQYRTAGKYCWHPGGESICPGSDSNQIALPKAIKTIPINL